MNLDEVNVREHLLATINWFVPQAAKLVGVRRIALLGSIMTAKKDPKDIDFLVTIEDDADLELLARLGRQAKGHAQHINHGADIFLANVRGDYIGRICEYRECKPRVACDALNCMKRPHLHDDLNTIKLSPETMGAAMELWPTLESREGLPEDLTRVLDELRTRM